MMTPPKPDIRYLFEPRGVAVIGASSNPAKIGHQLVNNIVYSGFQGAIYPINPRGGQILDLPVYPDLGAVAGPVDVAVIVIPAKFTMSAVKASVRQASRTGAAPKLVHTDLSMVSS